MSSLACVINKKAMQISEKTLDKITRMNNRTMDVPNHSQPVRQCTL